jgi:hypothetical protein
MRQLKGSRVSPRVGPTSGASERERKTSGPYLVLDLLVRRRQRDFFGKDVADPVQFHRLPPIIKGACNEHLLCTVRPTCKCEEPTSQRSNPGCVSVPREDSSSLRKEGGISGRVLVSGARIAHERNPSLSLPARQSLGWTHHLNVKVPIAAE